MVEAAGRAAVGVEGMGAEVAAGKGLGEDSTSPVEIGTGPEAAADRDLVAGRDLVADTSLAAGKGSAVGGWDPRIAGSPNHLTDHTDCMAG